jgi:hypothetical protein
LSQYTHWANEPVCQCHIHQNLMETYSKLLPHAIKEAWTRKNW